MKALLPIMFLWGMWIAFEGSVFAHGDITKLPDPVQIMQYKLLIYMDPDDLASRNRLAMAFYRTGKLDEAQRQLQYVLDKDKDNFDALDGLGIVLMRLGQLEEARELLEKARSLRKDDVMVHVHLYVLYKRLGLGARAEKELEKAMALCKDDKKALSNINTELRIVGE